MKKKILIISIVFLIILIGFGINGYFRVKNEVIIEEVNENEEEVIDDMNEYNNYTDLGIVSSKKPQNTHLWWETNAGGLYLVDSADNTKLYYSSDKADNWTQIDIDPSDVSGDNKSRIFKIQAAWHDITNKIIWFADCDNVKLVSDYFDVWKLDYSVSETSPTVTYIGRSILHQDNMEVVDIFKIGSDIYVLCLGWIGTEMRIVYEVSSHPFTYKIATAMDFNSLISYGVLVGTRFWNVRDEVTPIARIYLVYYESSDDSMGISTLLNDYSIVPANQQGMAYDGTNIIYFVANKDADGKDYLIAYSISGDSFTVLGEYNIGLMMDRNTVSNVMEKAFHLTEDKIYQLPIIYRGRLNLISVISTDAVWIAITYNFAMNNDGDIFESVNQIEHILEGMIYHRKRDYPTFEMKYDSNNITVVPNMRIQIIGPYTKNGSTVADQIIFEGIAQKPSKGVIQQVLVINQSEEMDHISPSGSKAGRSDEIITDINNDTSNNPEYIRDGTLSAGGAMGTILFEGGKILRKVYNEFADHDNFEWYLKPQGDLDYNNGAVDSGADIRYDGSGNLDTILQMEAWDIVKINRVIVKGAINLSTGAPYTGSWDDPEDQQLNGINTLEVNDASLNTNALCTTRAEKIGAREIVARTTAEFKYRKVIYGFIQPGQTFTFKYTMTGHISITEAQYILNAIAYDIKGDIGYIECSSNLFFDYGDPELELPQENSQRIEQVSTGLAVISDSIESLIEGIASDDLIFSNDTERTTGSTTYIKIKEITVYRKCNIRVYWEMKKNIGPFSVYSKVYVNGIAVGSEHSDVSITYLPYSEDVSMEVGDLLQIYAKAGVGQTCYIRYMRIKGIEYINNDP